IILHVIQAANDFSTAATIKLAQKFDPNGDRQLIACSKINKYDTGISDKLQFKGSATNIKIRYGCAAVLNRKPEEIAANLSFYAMRKLEQKFFKDNKEFDTVPNDMKGSDQLVKKLAKIQQERIRLEFPKIIEELKQKLQQEKDELREMPEQITTEIECWAIFNERINEYRESIYKKVHGNYNNESMMMDVDEASATTVISDITSNDERIAYQLYKLQ
ncbi:unnamed protein product, partial [Didymodactylos carnosus]